MHPEGEKLAANILSAASDNTLSKTKLMKIALFVEVEAIKRLGHRLTALSFSTDEHGVVCYDLVNDVPSSTVLCMKHRKLIFSGRVAPQYDYVLRKDAKFEFFDDEAMGVIRDVVAKWERKTARHLGDVSKRMVTWKVGQGDWQLGLKVNPHDIAFETSEEFRETAKDAESYDPSKSDTIRPIKELLSRRESRQL